MKIIEKILLLTAMVLVIEAAAQQRINTNKESLPAFKDLKQGWNTLKPGGETRCAFDTPYEFYVRPSYPERILIYFNGGGACWDYRTCSQPDLFYNEKIYSQLEPQRTGGILDVNRTDNPFSKYTIVTIPVCTGDTNLGAQDMEYYSAEGESIKVMHRGSINVQSVLAWLQDTNLNPAKIFVAGSSAGAVATPFYASVLADLYPEAEVVGLMDDASSYVSGKLPDVNTDTWGVPNMMKAYKKWADVVTGVRMDVLTQVAANNTKNLRLYVLDHAKDRTQHYFHREGGSPNLPMRDLMDSARKMIKGGSSNIRGFLLGGDQHVTLVAHKFYFIKSNNVFLKDWVKDISEGKEVSDIDCINCDLPEFSYQQTDLEILEKIKLKLSDKSNWGPDEEGSCPRDPKTFSLRCALLKSISETSKEPPGNHTILWEIIYRTSAKQNSERNAMTVFNNDPSVGYDGVMELLNEIENTIENTLMDQLSQN
jgi:hypothetical protein